MWCRLDRRNLHPRARVLGTNEYSGGVSAPADKPPLAQKLPVDQGDDS